MALTALIKGGLQQESTYIKNGISQGLNEVQFPLQNNVPLSPNYFWSVCPAPVIANCVASSQAYNAGGFVTLNASAASMGTAPNIACQPYTFGGQTGVLMDMERCLTFTFASDPITACDVIIKGTDSLGRAMTYQTTGGFITTAATSFTVPQPFSLVLSIQFTADWTNGTGSPLLTVGNGFQIGLPYYLGALEDIIIGDWNSTALALNTTVYQIAPNWRVAANLTTTTNAPLKGTITVPDAPDGIKVLSLYYYLTGNDAEINANVNNLNASSLIALGVQNTTVAMKPALPIVTSYDLTGVAIPAQSNFVTAYTALLAT